jgi:nucleoside-diphosphate-sugar epimerase
VTPVTYIAQYGRPAFKGTAIAPLEIISYNAFSRFQSQNPRHWYHSCSNCSDEGVTGYIGGQIFHDLIQLKNPNYDLTALIRDEERADKLRNLAGVKTVLGDLDSPNLPEIASEFDVVLHTASSDHPVGAAALANGLEQRATTSARKPLLIHTSGTGVLCDDAYGRFASDVVYTDEEMSLYHSLPPTAWHKNVDDVVFAAAYRGKIDCLIICPPLIWGLGHGIFKKHSIQIPAIASAYMSAGKAYTIEDGAELWVCVNILDISQLYLIVLDTAIQGNIPKDPRERYYFGESAEFVFKDAAQAVADELYARGKLGSAKVEKVPMDGDHELVQRIALTALGHNSRSKAVKARKLGWRPVNGGEEGFLADAKNSVDYAIHLADGVPLKY